MRGTWALRAVLALYPPWWRARYGEEVRVTCADVLAAGRSSWRVLANLAFGAIRTRLRGANMPMQFECWAGRTRASIVVATVPVLAVLPVIFTFRQGAQNPTDQTATLPWDTFGISGAGRLAEYAFAVMALAVVLAMSTLLWGYLDLAGAVRKRGHNDRGLRRLVRVPWLSALFAAVLWVTAFAVHRNRPIGAPSLSGHPALAYGLLVAAGACLGLGLAAALLMVVQVPRRARLTMPDLSSGKWVALTSSVLLWVVALAATTSMVALGLQRSGSHPATSMVTTSWGSWWVAGVLVLLAAAVVSSLGAASASRSLRVAAQLRP
jgi:hypothetical protein